MLPKAISLKDLALTSPGYDPYQLTSALFQALAEHKMLRRICFSGTRDLSEDALVAFSQLHAHSLRCIILDHVYLIGSWSNALGEVALATHGKLKFFRARDVKELDPEAYPHEPDPRSQND